MSQKIVTVTTKKAGFIFTRPKQLLYEKRGVTYANGIAQMVEDEPFDITVASFSSKPQRLMEGILIGAALPHPLAAFPSNLTAGEVLGISPTEEPPEPILLMDENVQVERLKETLEYSKAKVPHMEHINVDYHPEEYQLRVRELFTKFHAMSNGIIVESNTTEHHIDLISGSCQFACPPYRVEPK